MRAAILLALCLPALAVAQTRIARSEVTALKREGYAFYEGRWRLPQEIAYLRTAASRRFSGSTPAAPAIAQAPADVLRLAAHRVRPLRRSTGTGLLTVRLQNVQLLGLDPVTVSLGTGQARLQLPRTQSIGIGTTVGLPFR